MVRRLAWLPRADYLGPPRSWWDATQQPTQETNQPTTRQGPPFPAHVADYGPFQAFQQQQCVGVDLAPLGFGCQELENHDSGPNPYPKQSA